MRLPLSFVTVVACLIITAGVADAASSKSSSICSSTASTICKAPAVKRVIKKAFSSAKAKVKAAKSSSSTKAKSAGTSVDCSIKGNISATKEKIYHVIGCPNYNQTIIDSSKGEAMFCSEAEAKTAGWRKALNCK